MSRASQERRAALRLVGSSGEFTAHGVTYQCTVQKVDGDNPPLLVIRYVREGQIVTGAYIPFTEFKS